MTTVTTIDDIPEKRMDDMSVTRIKLPLLSLSENHDAELPVETQKVSPTYQYFMKNREKVLKHLSAKLPINILVIGHSGSGKSTLISQLICKSGGKDRKEILRLVSEVTNSTGTNAEEKELDDIEGNDYISDESKFTYAMNCLSSKRRNSTLSSSSDTAITADGTNHEQQPRNDNSDFVGKYEINTPSYKVTLVDIDSSPLYTDGDDNDEVDPDNAKLSPQEQYLKNLILATSTIPIDAAMLVIDASYGSFEAGFSPCSSTKASGYEGSRGETCEHLLLLYTLGIRTLIVVINKIDELISENCENHDNYNNNASSSFSSNQKEVIKERYDEIKQKVLSYLVNDVGYTDENVTFVPISAYKGYNLMTRSQLTLSLRLGNGSENQKRRQPCLHEIIDSLDSNTIINNRRQINSNSTSNNTDNNATNIKTQQPEDKRSEQKEIKQEQLHEHDSQQEQHPYPSEFTSSETPLRFNISTIIDRLQNIPKIPWSYATDNSAATPPIGRIIVDNDTTNNCNRKHHLSLAVIGHTNVGKSTILGHLISSSPCVDGAKNCENQSSVLESGDEKALILDKLDAENFVFFNRARDITKIKMSTAKYDFTVFDTPGSSQRIKNMIVAMSSSDAALLVVDGGTDGAFEESMSIDGQTREHSLLSCVFGVKQMIVVISKMDLLPTTEKKRQRYYLIYNVLSKFLNDLGYDLSQTYIIPASGKSGDNLLEKTKRSYSSWYSGPSLLDAFNKLKYSSTAVSCDIKQQQKQEQQLRALSTNDLSKLRQIQKLNPLRLSLQYVKNVPNLGTVASGRIVNGIIVSGMNISIASQQERRQFGDAKTEPRQDSNSNALPKNIQAKIILEQFQGNSSNSNDIFVATTGQDVCFRIDPPDDSLSLKKTREEYDPNVSRIYMNGALTKLKRGDVISSAIGSKQSPAFNVLSIEAQVMLLNQPSSNSISLNDKLIIHCHSAYAHCTVSKIMNRMTIAGKVQETNPKVITAGNACLLTLLFDDMYNYEDDSTSNDASDRLNKNGICLDTFHNYASLGRFVLRNKSRTLAVGVITRTSSTSSIGPSLPAQRKATKKKKSSREQVKSSSAPPLSPKSSSPTRSTTVTVSPISALRTVENIEEESQQTKDSDKTTPKSHHGNDGINATIGRPSIEEDDNHSQQQQQKYNQPKSQHEHYENLVEPTTSRRYHQDRSTKVMSTQNADSDEDGDIDSRSEASSLSSTINPTAARDENDIVGVIQKKKDQVKKRKLKSLFKSFSFMKSKSSSAVKKSTTKRERRKMEN